MCVVDIGKSGRRKSKEEYPRRWFPLSRSRTRAGARRPNSLMRLNHLLLVASSKATLPCWMLFLHMVRARLRARPSPRKQTDFPADALSRSCLSSYRQRACAGPVSHATKPAFPGAERPARRSAWHWPQSRAAERRISSGVMHSRATCPRSEPL